MNKIKLNNALTDSEIGILQTMVDHWQSLLTANKSGQVFTDIYQKHRHAEILELETDKAIEFLNVHLFAVLQDYLLLKSAHGLQSTCPCEFCVNYKHSSDCAVHNAPAFSVGECNCKE